MDDVDAPAEPEPPSQAVVLPPPPSPDQLAETLSAGRARAAEVAVANARAAIQRILGATDDELRSRSFLLDCIRQVGIRYQDWPGLATFGGCTNAVDYGMVQIPTEFADYLLLSGPSRPRTAIEIGVHRGATAYVAAAYFYRLNKQHAYTAVDVYDSLADFDYFGGILPIQKAAPATSGHFAGREFDLAFIDGDHSYDGSRVDWLNVGRSAGLVAFHDIKGIEYDDQNGGVRRTWSELKLEYRTTRTIIEVSHHADWMGIGMLFNRPPAWSAPA